MVSAQKIVFQYPSNQPLYFPDFDLAAGASCLILGQSGSGKTTLLHILAGLLQPQSGSLKIAGTDTTLLSTAQRDNFRKKHIGLVFQKNHLIKSLSAIENVQLTGLVSGATVSHQKAKDLLSQLGLLHRMHAPAYQLSVGEQQRVAIARALVHEPDVLLADEPTSALDNQHAAEVAQLLIASCADLKTALVIVTHDHRLATKFENHITL